MKSDYNHDPKTNDQGRRELAGNSDGAGGDVRMLDENAPKRGRRRARGGDVHSAGGPKTRKPLSQLIAGDNGGFKIANLAVVLFSWWAVFQIPGPPPIWTVWVPAYVGLVYFSLVLLPFNMLRLKIGGDAWAKPLARLARWRRTFGLMAAAWFFLHFSTAVNYMRETYSVALLRERYEAATNPGMAALLVFFLLFITSYGWARRLLGQNWKRLQSLVWYCVPLILVHSVGAKWAFEGSLTHVSLVMLVLILTFAAIEMLLLTRVRHPDRWRHPAMIVAGLIAAITVRFVPLS